MPNATVKVAGFLEHWAIADDAGKFRFENLAPVLSPWFQQLQPYFTKWG